MDERHIAEFDVKHWGCLDGKGQGKDLGAACAFYDRLHDRVTNGGRGATSP
ncbi:MAG: hypothetical protein ACJA0P_002083 [Planctomycetota bacterium]|jgi:hypothetical protein